MVKGFFSPTAWVSKAPLPLLAQCEQCGLYKHCMSPKMPVSGEGRKKVLIIAEAPGATEDEKGIQLCGNAGLELVRLINRVKFKMRTDAWLTNAVICRPTNQFNKNREPTDKEITHCRPNLAKTLKELNPEVVIPLGKFSVKSLMPLAWKDGEVDSIQRWAGRQIPCSKLNMWVCPSFHPSYLLHQKKSIIPERMLTQHLKEAFALAGTRPWPKPPEWERKVDRILNTQEAANCIRRLMKEPGPFAIDYETTTIKPDGPHAQILCCALSNGKITISYPWHGEAIKATQEFIKSPIPKIAAQMQFEENWTWKQFGHGVRNWHRDTLLRAHWLDCRSHTTSVKFQAFVLLGTDDYDSYLEPYMKSKSTNLPNKLKEVEMSKLTLYCGLDALFEVLITQKHEERAKTWQSK